MQYGGIYEMRVNISGKCNPLFCILLKYDMMKEIYNLGEDYYDDTEEYREIHSVWSGNRTD